MAAKQICVIGAGYVGLPTALLLARSGHRVMVAERDPQRIACLEQGVSPIHEPGLQELLDQEIASHRLHFSSNTIKAIAGCDFVFLCVETPPLPDGSADLNPLINAAREIGPALKQGCILVKKSTAPIGTTALLEQVLDRNDVSVVSNPEFLREGHAIYDLDHPDRIVIGARNREAGEAVVSLTTHPDVPIFMTTPESAETIKYASNAFLATKVSFMNDLAFFCESAGADFATVAEAMGADPRIGHSMMDAGPGWGGSCFPKDTRALLHVGATFQQPLQVVRAAVDANTHHIERIIELVASETGPLHDAVIGILGLTFKAGTNDRRDSPAVFIAHALQARGATVRAYDPTVMTSEPDIDIHNLDIVATAEAAAMGADALVILTEWPQFVTADYSAMALSMRSPTIVDARNLLDPDEMRARGFRYRGLGGM